MSSVKDFKKFINNIIDEINYDIELYVGLNLDKNHYQSQQLYEQVHNTRVKYLEKINAQGLTKADYKAIYDEFLLDVDNLNKQLCQLISKS